MGRMGEGERIPKTDALVAEKLCHTPEDLMNARLHRLNLKRSGANEGLTTDATG